MKKLIASLATAALLLTLVPANAVYAAEDLTKVEVDKVESVGRFEAQPASHVVLEEMNRNTWENNDEFGLRLPAGFNWNKATKVNGKTITSANISGRTLIVDVAATTGIDRIRIEPVLDVEKDAVLGDVKVQLTGRFSETDTEIVVAQVNDYGLALETLREIKQEYGDKEPVKVTFTVSELIDNSMIKGGLYDLTLTNANFDTKIAPEIKATGNKVLKSEYSKNDNMTISYETGTEKTKWNITVTLIPTFENRGDITLALTGRDTEEEVILVDVTENIEMTVATPGKVSLGYQNQELPALVIEEKAPAALIAGEYAIKINPVHAEINYTVPEMKVTAGNAEIANVKLDKNILSFRVSNASSRASKIEVTGMKVTPGANAFLGDYKAELYVNYGKSTEAKVGEAVLYVATAPTTDPSQPMANRIAQFIIGQTSYDLFLDGVKNTEAFDVAPYIAPEAGRTMMSVKAVGNALGMEVLYNAEKREVTVNYADKLGKLNVAVFTIDSKVAMLNGEVQPLDIAPVIKDSRTFIPVAYVARFMGAETVWDGPLQMVTVTVK